ncbi:4'-phosphopantetheinyl transferase family protein [Streptomyces sp. NPDC059063]|uniref:4'-phosphopantetheinyl transferase family protein n=1 Tax=unclassified Streptomyces TaxID=2593676 RepID=UPI00368C32B7
MGLLVRVPAPGLDDSVTLDPACPLRVSHVRGPLTLAVVSIAWVRARGEAGRAALQARHLTAEERARAAELPVPKRRVEWMAGRLAVKHGVSAYLRRHGGGCVRTRDVSVGTVARGIRAGKPTVDGPVEVGLTHSGDLAVAVCGPRAVGIDLERTRQVPRPLAELLTHVPRRCPVLDTMPLSLRWACKEAVLKHLGFGLRVDTREVELTAWRPDGRFSWRPGPDLRRHAPTPSTTHLDSWAREVNGYSLALVWS